MPPLTSRFATVPSAAELLKRRVEFCRRREPPTEWTPADAEPCVLPLMVQEVNVALPE